MDELKSFILDIIFPRRCLGCDVLISEPGYSYICNVCLSTITFKNEFACAFCKSPVVAGRTCPFCGPSHFLDKLLVMTSYENPLIEKILKTMKYRFVKTLADDIGQLMIRYLEKNKLLESRPDMAAPIIIPVPLHRLRLNWRGFNQSEIIANTISKHFGLNLAANALKRNRASAPQAEIQNRYLRVENIKNAFVCPTPESVEGKVVLLIDDVSTTGSTLDGCADVLKSAGAKEVVGLVFARN